MQCQILQGKAFSGELQNKQRLKFSGDIEVKCEIGNNRTTIYKYPIEIMVINTNPDVCDRDLISDTPASVDFGTSSTCVAIEGDEKTELLSLSSNDINLDDNNSYNIFENPTNIMIYRWKNLYEEWKQINDDSVVQLDTEVSRLKAELDNYSDDAIKKKKSEIQKKTNELKRKKVEYDRKLKSYNDELKKYENGSNKEFDIAMKQLEKVISKLPKDEADK